MNHIPYQAKGSPRCEFDVDYIVVGSGAGGGTSAVELARGGARVALVEAGPSDSHTTTRTPWSASETMDDWTQCDAWTRLWPVVQASVVGGTTVVNSAICVKTPGDVFDLWRKEHGICNDGEDAAIRANQEAIAELGSHRRQKRARVTRTGREDRRHALGYHDTLHRYVKDCLVPGSAFRAVAQIENRAST